MTHPTNHEEMVEAVARALAKRSGQDFDKPCKTDEEKDARGYGAFVLTQQDYLADARAALAVVAAWHRGEATRCAEMETKVIMQTVKAYWLGESNAHRCSAESMGGKKS